MSIVTFIVWLDTLLSLYFYEIFWGSLSFSDLMLMLKNLSTFRHTFMKAGKRQACHPPTPIALTTFFFVCGCPRTMIVARCWQHYTETDCKFLYLRLGCISSGTTTKKWALWVFRYFYFILAGLDNIGFFFSQTLRKFLHFSWWALFKINKKKKKKKFKNKPYTVLCQWC